MQYTLFKAEESTLLVCLDSQSLQSCQGDRSGERSSAWRRRLWRWIVDWLTEPIAFPGMTFDFGRFETKYNQGEDRQLKPHSQNDERRPSQS
jgi:hypothetical protein